MFPLLQLGGIAIQVPGLILLAGLWIGLSLVENEAKRQGRTAEPINGLIIAGLFSGLLGARLWYVGRYLDTYLSNPLNIVSLNTNTLDTTAGLVVGLVAAVSYGYRKRLSLRPTLDILTPALAFFAISLGFAHLASGDAFGTPADVPWAIQLWDARRHPTQVYEIILATIIFGLVWRWRAMSEWQSATSAMGTSLENPFPGFLFLAWVALTAVARLFLDTFRGDSVMVAGTIHQAQLAALAILLGALWLMRQWSPALADTG